MKIAFLATPLKHNETVLSDIAPVLHMVNIPGSICVPKIGTEKDVLDYIHRAGKHGTRQVGECALLERQLEARHDILAL